MRWFLGALAGLVLAIPLLWLLLVVDVLHISLCSHCGYPNTNRGLWLVPWLLIAGPISGAILAGSTMTGRDKLRWIGGLILLPIAIQVSVNGVLAADYRKQTALLTRQKAEQDQKSLQAALAAFGATVGEPKTSVVLMSGCGAERLVAVEGPEKQVWYLVKDGAVTTHLDAERLQAVLSPLLPAGARITRLAATAHPYVIGFALSGPAGDRSGEASLVIQQCQLMIQSAKLEGQTHESYPAFSLGAPPPPRDRLRQDAWRAALAAFPYADAAVSFGNDWGHPCEGVLVHLAQDEEHAWYWYDSLQQRITGSLSLDRFRELITPYLPHGARIEGLVAGGDPWGERAWFTFALGHEKQNAVAFFEAEGCRFALKELHIRLEVKQLNIPLD